MSNYRIYIKSNNNPRTINTPMMSRTNYDVITINGTDEDVTAKITELLNNGETVTEIRKGAGGVHMWYYVANNIVTVYTIRPRNVRY